MNDLMHTSTSLSSELNDLRKHVQTRCPETRGKTPSELWDELHALEPLDLMVVFDDGTVGRPSFDPRSGEFFRVATEEER